MRTVTDSSYDLTLCDDIHQCSFILDEFGFPVAVYQGDVMCASNEFYVGASIVDGSELLVSHESSAELVYTTYDAAVIGSDIYRYNQMDSFVDCPF